MSMNQYRGREETDKKDFGNKSVEEQKEISKKNISSEQDAEPSNEKIGEDAKKKFDREQARKIH